jgi:multiple sugar transport system substrate-binding protein
MNQPQTEVTARLLQELRQQTGYVTVETFWESGGWDPLVEKLYTAIAGNTPPSAARVPDNNIKQLVGRAVFTSLDPFVKKDRAFDPAAFMEIQYLRGRGFDDGKQYTLPIQASVHCLFYNQDLLEKAGAPVPQPTQPLSWEQFVETAVRVRRLGEDTWGWRFSTFSPTWDIVKAFVPWLWSNGAEYVDKTETKPLFNSDRGVEALQLWADLAAAHQVAPRPGMTNPAATTGQVGMWQDQSTSISAMKLGAPTVRFGATLMPKGKGPASVSVQAGSYVGIVAKTDHPDESWQLLRWLTGEENNRRWVVPAFYDPVNKASFSKPPFSEEPAYRPFPEQFKNARTRPDNPAYRPSEDTTAAEIVAVLEGQKGAATALNDAAQRALAVIATGQR